MCDFLWLSQHNTQIYHICKWQSKAEQSKSHSSENRTKYDNAVRLFAVCCFIITSFLGVRHCTLVYFIGNGQSPLPPPKVVLKQLNLTISSIFLCKYPSFILKQKYHLYKVHQKLLCMNSATKIVLHY